MFDERFVSNAARITHRLELVSAISTATRTHTRDELMAILAFEGVPCSPINSVSEAFALADKLGLDAVWSHGGDAYVRNPITMDATPPRFLCPPPGLDADGEEIRQWLST